MNLWVDDLRPPPDSRPSPYNLGETISDGWWWAKNSKAAIDWLRYRKQMKIPVDVISLDHDLGADDTTRPIVLWMCEQEFWPDQVRVHTANPVGREWLEGMVARYAPG
jgi:hypothetical protein